VAVIAALLLVLLLWLARRDPGERVVTVAATPKIVTVPVLMTMPPPGAPAPLPTPVPAPPAPAPLPSPHLSPPIVQVRAAPTPPTPSVPAPDAPSDVTTRYREVGQLLRTRGTDDLWQRYRWIRLGDCLQSETKRSDCVRMLDAIASDARGQ